MTEPVQTLPGPTSDLPAPESSPVIPAPSSLLPLSVKETRSNHDCKKVLFLRKILNAFLLGLHDLVKIYILIECFPQENKSELLGYVWFIFSAFFLFRPKTENGI